eukprot:CAMPEP_0182438998 /NCGR_PEP_ID=MMETSP1167-20130531/86156_1 /TAXON_ID=2988 /ORGANISM="Mallomonas Sp, Strain CCMP3275" /LENGTH=46 /DNA_ID= /DNA_START= /DNA_END= /DNA_ORIENTATION=
MGDTLSRHTSGGPLALLDLSPRPDDAATGEYPASPSDDLASPWVAE